MQLSMHGRLFLAAYILSIVSSLFFVRNNDALALAFLVARLLVLVGLVMAWLLKIGTTLRVDKGFLLVAVLLLPYAATPAYMMYVDTAVLFLFASLLNAEDRVEVTLMRVAYLSLSFVVFCALLGYVGILPAAVFEWGEKSKNSLGFVNPNTLFYYIFSSAFVFFALKDKRGFLSAGLIMAVLYPLVQSRAYAIGYIMLGLCWVFQSLLGSFPGRVFLWIWLGSIAGLGVASGLYPLEMSLAISFIFDIDINEMLSNRLELMEDRGSAHGMLDLLLGGISNDADSLFVYWINAVGLPLSLLLLGLIVYQAYKHSAWFSPRLMVVVCVYFTVGLIETPYDASSLVALLFVWMVFYNKRRERGVKSKKIQFLAVRKAY